MRAGRLRHRVQLQRRVAIKDGYGEKQWQWVDVAVVWASVEDISQRSKMYEHQSDQAYHAADKQVIIRYREVEEGWRVVFRGRSLNVDHIDNRDTRNVELCLMCSWVREVQP